MVFIINIFSVLQNLSLHLDRKLDCMKLYEDKIKHELELWQLKMLKKPSLLNGLAKRIQVKINGWIPEKVHKVITSTIKQMVRAVLFGARYTTAEAATRGDLQLTEIKLTERIKFYRSTAAIEGGITGAGGILLGLADFPLLLVIKIKLLFEIAALYGYDTSDYKERLYILYIFKLAFCSHEERRKVYLEMVDWDRKSAGLPADIHEFDWRTFQQEYRDYIDLAKMAQLVPVIGAPIGVVANFQLIKKLGYTAMNAYRMRLLPVTKKSHKILSS